MAENPWLLEYRICGRFEQRNCQCLRKPQKERCSRAWSCTERAVNILSCFPLFFDQLIRIIILKLEYAIQVVVLVWAKGISKLISHSSWNSQRLWCCQATLLEVRRGLQSAWVCREKERLDWWRSRCSKQMISEWIGSTKKNKRMIDKPSIYK